MISTPLLITLLGIVPAPETPAAALTRGRLESDTNGLIARRTGNVVWIGHAHEASPHRTFSGRPIDVDYANGELKTVLLEVAAAHGPAKVEFPEGLGGRVWIKLQKVPWDQVFDLLVNVNALSWTRRGDTFVLSVKPRPRREP